MNRRTWIFYGALGGLAYLGSGSYQKRFALSVTRPYDVLSEDQFVSFLSELNNSEKILILQSLGFPEGSIFDLGEIKFRFSELNSHRGLEAVPQISIIIIR
jgi:hypothetical protein